MSEGFFAPLSRALTVILDLLPRMFALVAVLAIGLIVAWLARRLVLWLLTLLRLDRLAQRLGLKYVFSALRVNRPLPALLADVVYGLVLVVFLVVGLDAFDPTSAGALVQAFYAFLPRILVAALILIAGYAVSVFVCQWALVAAVNAQWRLARPVSTAVQLLVIVLALSMALEQLGIAQGIVVSAFGLSFGGIVLALALAFGIGGADLARRVLENRLGKKEGADRPDEFSHI